MLLSYKALNMLKCDSKMYNISGKEYPDTTAEEPLMLFNKNNNNVSMAPEPEVPKFPVFPNIVSVENDASQAKVH